MGRNYDSARMALSTIDDNRDIPVISQRRQEYSGFHQGSGETMVHRTDSSRSPEIWPCPYRRI